MRIGGQATVTGTTATKGVPWVHILAHKQDKMQLGTAEGFVSVSVFISVSSFLCLSVSLFLSVSLCLSPILYCFVQHTDLVCGMQPRLTLNSLHSAGYP